MGSKRTAGLVWTLFEEGGAEGEFSCRRVHGRIVPQLRQVFD